MHDAQSTVCFVSVFNRTHFTLVRCHGVRAMHAAVCVCAGEAGGVAAVTMPADVDMLSLVLHLLCDPEITKVGWGGCRRSLYCFHVSALAWLQQMAQWQSLSECHQSDGRDRLCLKGSEQQPVAWHMHIGL
jgi:hypothetical protein